MWVFGYGSLIWKADFPYEKKIVGYIKGYVRRFYQKSVDHRGVPNKPGRVVTLMASRDPEDEVWGVAYKISKDNIEHVGKHLNSRESGYERRTVLFNPCKTVSTMDGDLLNSNITTNILITKNSSTVTLSETDELPFHVTVYISREDSPLFTGTEDLNTIANHILECCGPSGPNIEYLYKLAAAMRLIAPTINDEHLYSLEEAVKKLEVEKQYYTS
ncbi:putative glutathione-specific gamma-glutamylcyclotransferase 2 [Leptopilina heterotoma]|uniref:putative glutathione-specific gamma-glutamylcyclotransferase 2 n=1 Tax=Leptopilina heterotoma TaxID=63436 RepID=UPI001CA94CF2|nr:putative glutathione-specific gamma-glutamylcyclotransferase 2 [Leptopilina heterotoma]XP_043477487.1 putative glutathione-specific gamma-glutamylcyclotransferase 2 [Leptopilina heterotoma]